LLRDKTSAFEDSPEYLVVEEMDRFWKIAEEAVGGVVADVGDPAGPGIASFDAGFVGWDEGLESLHIGCCCQDEDLATGAEGVLKEGCRLFELATGEEVEYVGGVG